MNIEDKGMKPATTELWTVAPGSVVRFGSDNSCWFVTDSCDAPGDDGVYTRQLAEKERCYSIVVIDLSGGELEWRFGQTSVTIIGAKVVVG